MIEAYKNLGHAIVEQALVDYKRNPNMRAEVRRFIKSQYFEMISDLEAKPILDYLEKIDRKKR